MKKTVQMYFVSYFFTETNEGEHSGFGNAFVLLRNVIQNPIDIDHIAEFIEQDNDFPTGSVVVQNYQFMRSTTIDVPDEPEDLGLDKPNAEGLN